LDDRGDEVLALSRRPTRVGTHATLTWDPAREPLPPAAREGLDAIVNLAGAPIAAGRWRAAQREAIRSSRLTATRGVVAALGDDGPRVLVNASAVGFYGDTEDPVDERTPAGSDFLAGVCVEWEREALVAADRARVVVVRSGLVLARDGGAFPPLLRAARVGVLGVMGTGRQWVPWIHVDDEVAALLHCLDRSDLASPVNLVAPRPERQADVARLVRRAVHRPPTLPAPSFLLRAVMGPASALVLGGQRVVPAALEASGFTFAHPSLEPALTELLAQA
jgi:hypothetical protein